MAWPKKDIYPIWYFNKKPNSDKDFILKRMAIIPLEHKRKISDRYEIIYQKPTTTNNRKRANTFLNKLAKWFYNESSKPKLNNKTGK